jgi:hypothetical protein
LGREPVKALIQSGLKGRWTSLATDAFRGLEVEADRSLDAGQMSLLLNVFDSP